MVQKNIKRETENLMDNVVSTRRAQDILTFCLQTLHQAMTDEELEAERKGTGYYSYEKTDAVAFEIAPIMIWGPPGVGKSSMILAVAKDLGIDVVDIRLAQKDPVEIRGLPVPQMERGKPHYQEVMWYLSAEWPRDVQGEKGSKGIIFFDELTASDKALQVAAYEIILDRKLGDVGPDKSGYKVPPGWFICAAGNELGDQAVVQGMSSALANRFLHLVVRVNPKDWLEWAVTAGIHPTIHSFLADAMAVSSDNALFYHSKQRLHNMEIEEGVEKGWPSPRSWTRVSALIDLYEGLGGASGQNQSFTKDTFNNMISGLIGNELGSLFTGWYESFSDTVTMLHSTFYEVSSRDAFKELNKLENLLNPSNQKSTGITLRQEFVGQNPVYYATALKDANFAQLLKTYGSVNMLISELCHSVLNDTWLNDARGQIDLESSFMTAKNDDKIRKMLESQNLKDKFNTLFEMAWMMKSNPTSFNSPCFVLQHPDLKAGATSTMENKGFELARNLRRILENAFLRMLHADIAALRAKSRNVKTSDIEKVKIENAKALNTFLDNQPNYQLFLADQTFGGIIENPARMNSFEKNLQSRVQRVYDSTRQSSRHVRRNDYMDTDNYSETRENPRNTQAVSRHRHQDSSVIPGVNLRRR